MKTECLRLFEMVVEEEIDVVVSVIDKSERRHTARLKSEITHHALWRSEREFATGWQSLRRERSLKACLQVVDVKVMVAMEAYEVMAVTLMIAHEDILAMHASIIFPPSFGFFDGLSLWVIVTSERDVMFTQVCQYGFFSCHSFIGWGLLVFGWGYISGNATDTGADY